MASMIAQEYDYQYQEDEHLFTENAYEAAVAIPAKKILTEVDLVYVISCCKFNSDSLKILSTQRSN